MPTYRPGDIVLMAFPFTDADEAKRRPALVLADTGDDDLLVARVTSQAAHVAFDVELQDWRAEGLLLPSVARLHKVATLEKRLVDRALGHLSAGDWRQVRMALQRLWTEITG
ncbi:MAG: type II toxin-antitoxin system PemK/MazF family toxin [Chloroflexi bacterium]|nr:type II toxin-antitoxin system PemK/MazF family toxin [Chloroflexota bacterium]